MKILHVCAIGDTAKTLLLTQVQHFLSLNLQVEIACSPGKSVNEIQKRGYIVHPVQIDRRISIFSNLKSIYQLIKIIQKNQYDLVHVHTPIAAFLGRIAARIAGVKCIVYTSHGLPFHDLSSVNEYFFYAAIEKIAALITDLILSQNHEDITTAKKLGLCTPEKLGYLGNGIDIDFFNRECLLESHQKQLRASLNIPAINSLVVGTIGRLTEKKGSGYLIEAVAALLPKFPNLHVLIIGSQGIDDPAPFYNDLVERIRVLGIENCITLTGQRTDIRELLDILDVFVLPTFHNEGLPRSILEAMAMNLPVVTTDVRGCREAVVHQKTGLIVPPKNSEKLTEALELLLSNPSLRHAYGRAGRQRVESEYDERFVFQRLAQFYQKLGIEIPDFNPAKYPT
jgi:glycosyltransferase involved in cell wall biosynthesis